MTVGLSVIVMMMILMVVIIIVISIVRPQRKRSIGPVSCGFAHSFH